MCVSTYFVVFFLYLSFFILLTLFDCKYILFHANSYRNTYFENVLYYNNKMKIFELIIVSGNFWPKAGSTYNRLLTSLVRRMTSSEITDWQLFSQ